MPIITALVDSLSNCWSHATYPTKRATTDPQWSPLRSLEFRVGQKTGEQRPEVGVERGEAQATEIDKNDRSPLELKPQLGVAVWHRWNGWAVKKPVVRSQVVT